MNDRVKSKGHQRYCVLEVAPTGQIWDNQSIKRSNDRNGLQNKDPQLLLRQINGRKEKVFLTTQGQLISGEGMMGIENPQLATITEVAGPGRSHPCRRFDEQQSIDIIADNMPSVTRGQRQV